MQESHIESWEVHMSEKYMQYVEVKDAASQSRHDYRYCSEMTKKLKAVANKV